MSFADHPCFAPGYGITTKGTACVRLSGVLMAFPDAYEARQALGDPFMPERSRRALAILSGLPVKMQAKILAADAGKRAKPDDFAGTLFADPSLIAAE